MNYGSPTTTPRSPKTGKPSTNELMWILIIGSNGTLGRTLVQEWTADEVIPATSRDADIRDVGQVRRSVTQEHPDWIVLTAAYTDIDG